MRCSFFDAVRHAVQHAVQVAQAQKVTASPTLKVIFSTMENAFPGPKITSQTSTSEIQLVG
jgi:hypothetical protein